MKPDLHCHTSASDGTLSPMELIDLARQHHVDLLAITDHDTTAGYQAVRDYASQKGIELISGVEISCQWENRTIHIVGLDFDVEHAGLQTGLERIRKLRWQRAEAMIERLQSRPIFKKRDLKLTLSQQMKGEVVGRGHFAQMLIEMGLIKNTQQAFSRFLSKGRIGYVKSEWPELHEVVSWIREAGGLAVIAHPTAYKLTSRKLNRLIENFIEAGGQGIEVVTQSRASSDMIGMAERARRFGLVASVGSDFHHPQQTWKGLGWLAPLPESCQPIWARFKAPVT